MASIVIRNLDEYVKSRLRVRAALNGRSMEAEVREILRGLLVRERSEPHNGAAEVRKPVRRVVTVEVGAVDMEAEPAIVREPPEFD
jgi:antitoxin FitA